jgi:hypothetical protein
MTPEVIAAISPETFSPGVSVGTGAAAQEGDEAIEEPLLVVGGEVTGHDR